MAETVKTFRRRRLECGFTQQALAAAAGLAVLSITNIENGYTRPRVSSLTRLSAALGCSRSDVLDSLEAGYAGRQNAAAAAL